MELNLAIIGVGWAGKRQLEAIKELGQKVNVSCIMDNDADHARSVGEEFGVQNVFTDYDSVLSDPEVNAVSICTPHNLHCPMALEAASAGKHILVEKPMALNVGDATRMIKESEKYGVRLYVAENLVYEPESIFLGDIVKSGKYVGELTFACMVRGFRAEEFGYPGRRAWLAQLDQGGTGTWMLHGIHSMAQLRYIFGEVRYVYVNTHRARSYKRTDLEGTVSGLLTLESGISVTIVQTSETRLPGNLGGYLINGDQGSVRASKAGYEIFSPDFGKTSEGDQGIGAHRASTIGNIIYSYPRNKISSYAKEIDAFVDYVHGFREGPTTGYSERRSLAIVQAGYESAENRRPVDLKSRFGSEVFP